MARPVPSGRACDGIEPRPDRYVTARTGPEAVTLSGWPVHLGVLASRPVWLRRYGRARGKLILIGSVALVGLVVGVRGVVVCGWLGQ